MSIGLSFGGIVGGGSGGVSGPTTMSEAMVYVSVDGDDGTAVIGDASKPFETAQAAYDAIVGASGSAYVLFFGSGTFLGISTGGTDFSTKIKFVAGHGPTASLLGGIATTGTGNGGDVLVYSDRSINLGNITTSGANGTDGAAGGEEEPGGSGSPGYQAGDVKLYNCVAANIMANGGTGGAGGSGGFGQGNGGQGGPVGAVVLADCTFNNLEQINGAEGSGISGAGNGSAAGVFVVTNCNYNDITNPADKSTEVGTLITGSYLVSAGHANETFTYPVTL